jgi:type I restriction enzyme S subunit
MKQRWNYTSFGNAPLEIIDGDRGKNYPQHTDFADEGFCVFLNAGNVSQSGFSFSNVQFIEQTKDDKLRKGKLKRDDVIMTTRGTIGNVAHYAQNIPFEHMRINSGMVIFRCDLNRLLPQYLYHFLRTPYFHGQMNSLRSGVAQPQLPIRDIKRIELPLPSLTEQSRIAEHISAYDELMENNRRRMELLEESARLLYREWFVRLRFPGHEHARVTHDIPEGWEKVRIDSSFTTVLGGTPSRARADYWESGTIPWINSGKVNEFRVIEASEFITDEALQNSAAKLMPKGTTILAITGATLGQVSMLEIQCAANQSVVGIIDPTGLRDEWIYLTFKERIDELVNRATGGAQVHINKDIVNAFEVMLPSKQTSELFQETAAPMFRQIALLLFQNQKLRAARDLLLPRLMSGEIAA